jgi:hypothetical protein
MTTLRRFPMTVRSIAAAAFGFTLAAVLVVYFAAGGATGLSSSTVTSVADRLGGSVLIIDRIFSGTVHAPAAPRSLFPAT